MSIYIHFHIFFWSLPASPWPLQRKAQMMKNIIRDLTRLDFFYIKSPLIWLNWTTFESNEGSATPGYKFSFKKYLSHFCSCYGSTALSFVLIQLYEYLRWLHMDGKSVISYIFLYLRSHSLCLRCQEACLIYLFWFRLWCGQISIQL